MFVVKKNLVKKFVFLGKTNSRKKLSEKMKVEKNQPLSSKKNLQKIFKLNTIFFEFRDYFVNKNVLKIIFFGFYSFNEKIPNST